MLTVKNLQVFYKDFKALDIKGELTINAGDRVGIIGSNGAGKTTFLKACLGLLPYQGNIISEVKPENIAVHMQHNNYVETVSNQTIIETVLQTSIKNNQKLMDLINFFDFKPQLKKKYQQLSGGQKQRLTLIMVLMQDTPLAFYDEVTTGLDFETRQALMEKIISWYQDKETALLFITHYYEELERLANKLLIIEKGHIVDYGLRKQLFYKYCGHSVIIFKALLNEPLPKEFKIIKAPEGMVAISCTDKVEELSVIHYLNQREINFKRSDNDIEIMVMNAIERNNHA